MLPCFNRPTTPLAANATWMRRGEMNGHLFAVVRRIIFLKGKGLSTQGVVASFLRVRIAPLQ